MPRPSVDAHLREPAAAPCPVAVERIGECAHQHRGDREGEELPALGAGAGHDGQGRIHEDHLEKEDDHHADVIGAPGEEHSAFAEDAPMGAEQRDQMLGVQRLQPAQISVAGGAAHLDGEADNPVGEQPARIDEEVHHVGVVGVFHATEPGFNHGETGLHEHDQKAGDQRPDKVDGDLVLADLVGNIAQGEAGLGVADGHIVDGAGESAAGIAIGQSGGCGRL